MGRCKPKRKQQQTTDISKCRHPMFALRTEGQNCTVLGTFAQWVSFNRSLDLSGHSFLASLHFYWRDHQFQYCLTRVTLNYFFSFYNCICPLNTFILSCVFSFTLCVARMHKAFSGLLSLLLHSRTLCVRYLGLSKRLSPCPISSPLLLSVDALYILSQLPTPTLPPPNPMGSPSYWGCKS